MNRQNLIDQIIKNKITRILPGLEVTASSISSSRYWREEVPEVAALQMSTFGRLCSVARVDQRNRSDIYPEMVRTVTLILGKAFSGLQEVAFDAFGAGGGTILGCFDIFSVGTSEDVRGRFEDGPVGAAARTGVLAGS